MTVKRVTLRITLTAMLVVSLVRPVAAEEEPPDEAFLEFLAEFEDAEADEWIDPLEVGKWRDKRLDKELAENEADELKAPK